MSCPLSIVWTIASLSASSGGPTRSVLAACNALSQEGLDVALLATAYGSPKLGATPRTNPRVNVTLVQGYPLPGFRDGIAIGYGRALSALVAGRQSAIIHDNGLWLSTNRVAARVARSRKIPLVISTRGMLAPWALNHRRWKKRIAWWLYQRSILESAVLLHATSEAEAKDIRATGLQNPIAVIPNAVDFPEVLPERQPSAERRRVLFLGRLHPIKGLENLLEAWAQVRPHNWELILAGPDEEAYQAKLEALVGQLGLGSEVRCLGAVDGDVKWKLYRTADLFVLPSFTENFGMAVAEALACEVPVITTRGTPWKELETYRCGWWVEASAATLSSALQAAMSLSDEQRGAMGMRGRGLVQTKCSGKAIAQELCLVYEWVVHGGSQPDFVCLGAAF
jgi:glycosyltransferase involved in cell wall biosynthesis